VLQNGSANVLAIIPSADPSRTFSNVTQAKRDLGSVFKTFTLASCLEGGVVRLNSIVEDAPLTDGELQSAPGYDPRDYDGRFLGPVPLILAFAWSRNLPFVRLGERCRSRLENFLSTVGLPELQPGHPTQYLGSYGATILGVAGAYLTFVNGGIYRSPIILSDAQDGVLNLEWRRAVSQKTAVGVMQAMRAVAVEGTGAAIGKAGLMGGAKTGTTTGAKDLWLCYTEPRFTVTLWVGRRDFGNLWPRASSASILPLAIEAIRDVRHVLTGENR